MVRAFTDRIDRIGTEAEPGVNWEYRGDAGPVDWDPSMLNKKVSPEALQGLANVFPEGADAIMDEYGYSREELPPNPNRPAPQNRPSGISKPPSSSNLPDYSAAGRERFASAVKEQLGFDPVTLNPYDELEAAEKRLMPNVFNKFFKGKVTWADRDQLSARQKKEWEEERLKFRAHVFNRAKEKKDIGMAVLKEGLGTFDDKAKEYNAMVAKIEKRMAAEQKALAEAPKEVGRVPQGGNQKTRHVWDPTTGTYIDTGEPWEGVTISQMLQQTKAENKILGEYKPGEKIAETELGEINTNRSLLRMPKIVEVEVKAPEKKELLGVDALWPDTAGQYEYYAEGSKELDAALKAGGKRTDQKTETASTTTPQTGEADIETQIKAQYPTAYKAVDGNWYYKDDSGQAYKLEIE